MTHIQRATVVGAGAMGSQIALLCALAGCDTTLVDVEQQRIDDAFERLRKTAQKSVDRGTRSANEIEDAFGCLSGTTDLGAAVSDSEIVIEAIVENLDAKRQLFAELDEAAPETTIFATNSSSIVSSKLANISHPERVCNMHFFNPALVMKLVEVVGGEHTAENTVKQVVSLAERMGKTPVVVKKEIFGFIANRIIAAIFDEAISLLENDVATIEDIDTTVVNGLGHPIGPFGLLDLTGIDVNYGIKQLEAEDTGDPSRGPSRTLTELYEAGHLGRKTGKGFYEYGNK